MLICGPRYSRIRERRCVATDPFSSGFFGREPTAFLQLDLPAVAFDVQELLDHPHTKRFLGILKLYADNILAAVIAAPCHLCRGYFEYAMQVGQPQCDERIRLDCGGGGERKTAKADVVGRSVLEPAAGCGLDLDGYVRRMSNELTHKWLCSLEGSPPRPVLHAFYVPSGGDKHERNYGGVSGTVYAQRLQLEIARRAACGRRLGPARKRWRLKHA